MSYTDNLDNNSLLSISDSVVWMNLELFLDNLIKVKATCITFRIICHSVDMNATIQYDQVWQKFNISHFNFWIGSLLS